MSGYWDDHPDAIGVLRDLWAKGLPASVIASTLELQFRSAITRNAVLGKVHRLGLNGRINSVRKSPDGPRDKRRKDRKAARREALGGVDRPRTPDDQRPMPALSRHAGDACQWIEGAARGRDFCLRRTIAGHSWCPDHFKRVFLPPKRKQSA
jgi:GcrA cell cycle regulator